MGQTTLIRVVVLEYTMAEAEAVLEILVLLEVALVMVLAVAELVQTAHELEMEVAVAM